MSTPARGQSVQSVPRSSQAPDTYDSDEDYATDVGRPGAAKQFVTSYPSTSMGATSVRMTKPIPSKVKKSKDKDIELMTIIHGHTSRLIAIEEKVDKLYTMIDKLIKSSSVTTSQGPAGQVVTYTKW